MFYKEHRDKIIIIVSILLLIAIGFGLKEWNVRRKIKTGVIEHLEDRYQESFEIVRVNANASRKVRMKPKGHKLKMYKLDVKALENEDMIFDVDIVFNKRSKSFGIFEFYMHDLIEREYIEYMQEKTKEIFGENTIGYLDMIVVDSPAAGYAYEKYMKKQFDFVEVYKENPKAISPKSYLCYFTDITDENKLKEYRKGYEFFSIFTNLNEDHVLFNLSYVKNEALSEVEVKEINIKGMPVKDYIDMKTRFRNNKEIIGEVGFSLNTKTMSNINSFEKFVYYLEN